MVFRGRSEAAPPLGEFPSPSSTIALFCYSSSQPRSDESKRSSSGDAILEDFRSQSCSLK